FKGEISAEKPIDIDLCPGVEGHLVLVGKWAVGHKGKRVGRERGTRRQEGGKRSGTQGALDKPMLRAQRGTEREGEREKQAKMEETQRVVLRQPTPPSHEPCQSATRYTQSEHDVIRNTITPVFQLEASS
ncbi:hypothetical protein KUCAC02_028419, partial [Chaenocephalus aceratus]